MYIHMFPIDVITLISMPFLYCQKKGKVFLKYQAKHTFYFF